MASQASWSNPLLGLSTTTWQWLVQFYKRPEVNNKHNLSTTKEAILWSGTYVSTLVHFHDLPSTTHIFWFWIMRSTATGQVRSMLQNMLNFPSLYTPDQCWAGWLSGHWFDASHDKIKISMGDWRGEILIQLWSRLITWVAVVLVGILWKLNWTRGTGPVYFSSSKF